MPQFLIDCLFYFFQQFCNEIFSSAPFSSCQNLLDIGSFSKVCMQDACNTENNNNTFICDTVSEFSRQCVHAGGKPQQWRNETFCSKCFVKQLQYSVVCLILSCTVTSTVALRQLLPTDQQCPYNMQFFECSSPCQNSCTNPDASQICDFHCHDSCACPNGTCNASEQSLNQKHQLIRVSCTDKTIFPLFLRDGL